MLQSVRGHIDLEALYSELKSIEHLVPEGIVKFRYSFDDDWSGDPGLYFWVMLTDEAAEKRNVHRVATAFETLIDKRIEPHWRWGLLPYYRYRSLTEQATLKGAEFE